MAGLGLLLVGKGCGGLGLTPFGREREFLAAGQAWGRGRLTSIDAGPNFFFWLGGWYDNHHTLFPPLGWCRDAPEKKRRVFFLFFSISLYIGSSQ